MTAQQSTVLAVDAVGIKHSGGARVLLHILEAALAAEDISHVVLFCTPRALRSYATPHSEKLIEMPQQAAEAGRIRRVLWQARGLSRSGAEHRAEVLLCATGSGHASEGTPHVTFVQQSLPYSDEALARLSRNERLRAAAIRYMTGRSVARAARVVVQTPAMKRALVGAFGLPESHVTFLLPGATAPCAGEADAGVLTRLRGVPKGDRILYVGNTSAYKNVQVLAPAVALLRQSLPTATVFLTWPRDHEIAREAGIRCLGYLDEPTLRAAYENADALVMPSLTETVGLPMLEAMSLGTPVLAADRPYAHDVCEEAALFFDPLSAEECASQLSRLLADAELRTALTARGMALLERRNAARPYDQLIRLLIETARAG